MLPRLAFFAALCSIFLSPCAVRAQDELCGILGDEVDQAALVSGNWITSMPSWNLTPAMIFGN